MVYRDLSTDATNDLVLSSGDLVLTVDLDAIAQDIRAQLQLVLGEWFLGPEQGVPMYQQIFIKNPNINVIRNTLRKAILAVLGVVAILSLNLTYTGSNRQLQVSFVVDTDSGIIDQTVTLGS